MQKSLRVEPTGITEKLKAKCNESEQFARFDNLFRQVISVPKAAVEKEDRKLKRKQKKKKARQRAG
jgi:hypothetical protein